MTTAIAVLLAGTWAGQPEADGSRIVFARREGERQSLWTCLPDGADLRRLTEEGFFWALPSWAPDGSRILAARTAVEGPQQLCAIAWPSGDTRILAMVDAFSGAAFSPDLKRIVLSDGQDRRGLDVLDLATGRRTRIFDGPGFAAYPSWSPDGRRVCFQTNTRGVLGRGNGRLHQAELFLMAPDGTGLAPVADDPDRYHDRGVWSPDGSEIAAVVGPWNRVHVRIYSATTGQLRTVLRPSTSVGPGGPAWSPESRRLACTVQTREGSRIALLHRDAPQREPSPLTPEDWTCHSPSWSPRLSR